MLRGIKSKQADIFSNNISRKMTNVETFEDVEKMMTSYTKENETAFWEYVKRKATRKLKKSLPLTNVEQLAINREKTQEQNTEGNNNLPENDGQQNPASLYNRFYTTVVLKLSGSSQDDILQEIKQKASTWSFIRDNFNDFERYLRKRSLKATDPDHIERLFKHNSRQYVFNSNNPPEADGFFVYYIQTIQTEPMAKIGKHSGSLKKLVSRYKTYYNWVDGFDVVCYDVSGYDYSLIETGILALMKAKNYIVSGEQIIPGAGMVFDAIMNVMTMVSAEPITNMQKSTPETYKIAEWYSTFLKKCEITKNQNDVIKVKDIYNDYIKYCLETDLKIPDFKTFTSYIGKIENKMANGCILGIKHIENSRIIEKDKMIKNLFGKEWYRR